MIIKEGKRAMVEDGRIFLAIKVTVIESDVKLFFETSNRDTILLE